MIVPDLQSLAVPIGKVKTMKGNPRRGDVDAVTRSLEAFGQRKPVVARVDTGEVIAGNHTFMAAQRLGWDEIAVVWVEDDDTTAKAFALADNRTSDLGGYDSEALAEMMAEVLEEEAELLTAASYSIADLDDLLAGAIQTESAQPAAQLTAPQPALPSHATSGSTQEQPSGVQGGESARVNVVVDDDDDDDDYVPYQQPVAPSPGAPQAQASKGALADVYEGFVREGPQPGPRAVNQAEATGEWFVARFGDLRLKVKREAYERIYDELLRAGNGSRTEALRGFGERLGVEDHEMDVRLRV